MKRGYTGYPEREGRGGFKVRVQYEDGRERPLDPRHDLWDHSPDGFAWGYGGSGPAQLALALAADYLNDDERAVRIHQRLKFHLVAGWTVDEPWELTVDQLLGAILYVETERDRELDGPSTRGTGAGGREEVTP